MENRLIALTTDFGHQDPFVGIMKGVILGINPDARIVDVTHGIAPQDIRGGALALHYAAPYFPPGTIHVAVIDPGVGTERRPILIECEDAFFVGPDNGVLSLAAERRKKRRVVELADERYRLNPVSATFHGRDIFAPSAAHLSLGVPPEDFGRALKEYTRLTWPAPIKGDGEARGEIIYIDHFGNLITNITERDLEPLGGRNVEIALVDVTICGLASSYAGAETGGYAALINSWGLLEISCYNARADQRSGAGIGDPVHARSAAR
ncbi:MAG TPA: SAM-dependent chlorinase/fluorinase [Candidatus Binatia bacterium]|nr:SAM-dependent chlorinase/fluorinase [Candidatus Binatia bacterium]